MPCGIIGCGAGIQDDCRCQVAGQNPGKGDDTEIAVGSKRFGRTGPVIEGSVIVDGLVVPSQTQNHGQESGPDTLGAVADDGIRFFDAGSGEKRFQSILPLDDSGIGRIVGIKSRIEGEAYGPRQMTAALFAVLYGAGILFGIAGIDDLYVRSGHVSQNPPPVNGIGIVQRTD